VDRSFVAANGRELARMRALVLRLSDRQLGAMVNEYWSVAGVLGHIAFWDGRALYLARKLQRREQFTACDPSLPRDLKLDAHTHRDQSDVVSSGSDLASER
jgi:DinB family protein